MFVYKLIINKMKIYNKNIFQIIIKILKRWLPMEYNKKLK